MIGFVQAGADDARRRDGRRLRGRGRSVSSDGRDQLAAEDAAPRLRHDARLHGTGQRKGKHTLYPATVKASHAYENSYDLDYDDGDAESRVPARYVRPLATAAPTPLTTTSQAPPGGEL